MMSPQIHDPWRRLLKAGARPAEAMPSAATTPPPRLLDALRHQRAELWRIARTLIWRKWSLLLAVAAILAYMAVLVHHKSMESPASAIPRPETPSLLQP
jgi:transposase-like protein